jgi:tripartite-type tricarboxylate transporter receptor subunit TctC
MDHGGTGHRLSANARCTDEAFGEPRKMALSGQRKTSHPAIADRWIGQRRDQIGIREAIMITRRLILSAMAATSLCLSAAGQVKAQPYPARLIKLVVPNPPGGPSEIVIRTLAERLSSSLGRSVIVENRPGGANGAIGAMSVARAEPDGYTLLFSNPGPMVVAPAVYKNLGYDPVKSFAPIATIFSSPQVLAVNPAVPAKTVEELTAYAKHNPGMINFASPGYGSQPHLLGEMLKLITGIDIVHVPYRSAALAVTDLLAGQVQMEFETMPLLLPHIAGGKLRALAIAEEARSPQLPEVPTTLESGLPTLQATFWSGVLAPAGTPTSVVDRLNAAINEILKSKEIEAMLARLSARSKIGSPQDFAAFLATESQKWTAVVDAAGIRAD